MRETWFEQEMPNRKSKTSTIEMGFVVRQRSFLLKMKVAYGENITFKNQIVVGPNFM